MRHYVLTRSAYGPLINLERNRDRLRLTRGVTVRSLAAQTAPATWLVLIDEADPLVDDRRAAFLSSGLEVIFGDPGDIVRDNIHDLPWGPWAQYIDWSESVLTTRIDDDDAFAPWALAAYRRKAEEWCRRRARQRLVMVLPQGWRFADGKVNPRNDRVSQFSSLYAPRGDHGTVMDINHTRVRKLGRLMVASPDPGWLWVRHESTRSARSRASMLDRDRMVPVSDRLRAAFPIDWSVLGA